MGRPLPKAPKVELDDLIEGSVNEGDIICFEVEVGGIPANTPLVACAVAVTDGKIAGFGVKPFPTEPPYTWQEEKYLRDVAAETAKN
jgi:hypothetical protein